MTRAFGFAVDVGTTTLVAELVDLEAGAVVTASSAPNPQAQFGPDVMTRISFAQESKQHVEQLHSVLIDALNGMFTECLAGAVVAREQISDVVLVGNATMLHTVAGLDPTSLGTSPYRGALEQGWRGPAAELGLELPVADAFLPPGIRSHVGADTLAAMLATGLDTARAPAALIDLGTNSEIVVAGPRGLICTSTAAGPAFENAGEAGRLRGSQLITAVAERLRTGAVEPSGRMPAGDAQVSPEEVRQLQLAKAGVAAGLRVLLDKAGLDAAQLESVLIAGAFGNYLDTQSAAAIGLLPNIPADRVTFVGNAALAGARLLLIDAAARERVAAVAAGTKYIELGGQQKYAAAFVDEIPFPRSRARLVAALSLLTADIAAQSLRRCPYRSLLDDCTFRGPCRNRFRSYEGRPRCGGGPLNSSPA